LDCGWFLGGHDGPVQRLQVRRAHRSKVNLMAGYTAGRDASWRYESIEMSRGRLATSAASSIADAGTMGSCYRDDSSCNPDDRDREP